MRTSWAVLMFSCALVLSGCSGVPIGTTTKTSAVRGAALRGKVHGGQQPIAGASVYLYAANTTGYGNASVSLLTSASGTSQDGSGNYYVTTDANGDFGITGDYTCPSTASQVYLYAVGGDPGAGANSTAGLLAALGTCPANGTLSSTLFVFMNEVSTIATAYAIAGYATDATHVSSSGSAAATTGIANAFATVTNLETLGTGEALVTTPAGNGTAPQSEIDTLANILAACINSTGSSSTECSTLFSNATNGATAPTDTATAAINIAHNPGASTSTLFGLQPGTGAPFLPDLSTAPNDFTIAVSYTGGGLNQPKSTAVDGSGNVWTANAGGNSISKFSPLGAAISGSGGYTGGGLSDPLGIAIDGSGNVWIANAAAGVNSISKFSSTGAAISGSGGYTGGGLSDPLGIGIDGSGNVWTANFSNNSLSKFNSSGGSVSGSSGYTGGGLGEPSGVAIDASGNVWAANFSNNSLSEFNSSGTVISGSSGYTGGGVNKPKRLSIDASGNVWTVNTGNNSLSKFNSSGTALSPSTGYTGGGLSSPTGVEVDGSGNVWIANQGNNSVSEFNSSGTALSGSNGYMGGLSNPTDIAVDVSGNVWVGNGGSNFITEFVGAAGPVAATPLVEQPFNLAITTTSLPSGQVGIAYSATLSAIGGTKPYTWSVTSGNLSTWNLSLNSSTGVISGTPAATANAAPLTFKVIDSGIPQQQQSVDLTLTITGGSGMTVSVTPKRAGITTTQTLSLTPTTNDSNGVNWSASGSVCSGVGCGTFSAANTQTGVAVTYTPPATAGVYTITATSASESSVSASATVGVTDLAGMFTYHNDNSRDGANTHEYALTPSNVTSATFGKLFSCTVDSPIYTQPLWVPNLTINSAKHNVVLVATTNDSLYAFDADSNPSPCTASNALWHANLLDSAHGGTTGEAPVPSGTSGYLVGRGGGDIQPTVGVIGTPVIDPSTDTLYVVSKSYVTSGPTFYQRLHAIDLITGNEKFSGPVAISATFPGSGDGGTQTTFLAQTENQRCGLALANGVVYIAWASHEDQTPYYGWVIGYSASDLTRKYVYNDNPNQAGGAVNSTNGGAGIWMSGGAPAIDSSGNLYLLTGNGTFDANSASAPNNDYADSFLKLSSSLSLSDYFTPNYAPTDGFVGDNDFGSGGAVVLIDLPANGTNPTHVVIGGGKPGYFYVLNRDSMGGYGNATDSNAWQKVNIGDQIFATGAFWNNATTSTAGTYYLAAQYESIQAYSVNTSGSSSPQLTAGSATSNQFPFPGPTPLISSTPTYTNGILWALDNSNYCTGSPAASCGPTVLYAYDATNLATELWNSGTSAGHAMKFTVPTVANGKVYVPTRGAGTANDSTTGELDVFGLLPN